ncbi:hypothetical protein [Streptomyces indicus]|uniref:Dolichyl-phosphate-mannose-protein mannosyltransferase n=1 Tax=Streptomyces indicus TaxID=417292 RepID=A0A1G9CHZ2_9ACTN|nr:hypothetical protein [Streptomyces indicus]SDK51216.1 hypothetical protein SAMN05421806_108139 [Streptomyces indicus]
MTILRRLAAPLLLALVLAGFHGAGSLSDWGYSNDSYRYTRAAYEILGMPRAQAQAAARDAYCAAGPGTAACVAANPHGLKPDHPRYERVFDTRPGYPLLAAPFIALLGPLKGLWTLSCALTALSGVLAYRLLRGAGLGRRASLAGEAVLLAGGLGYWGARALADSLATPCLLLCGIGVVRILTAATTTSTGAGAGTGRRTAGLALFATGFLALALTKYSTALLFAVALAAAGGLSLWRRAGQRAVQPAALRLLTVTAAGVAGAVAAATSLLGLPAASETMQDTLTRYFTRPDVPDPIRGMLALEAGYWPTWFHHNAGFAALLGLCLWALWRHRPALLPFALAAGLTGLGTAFAHPLLEELDRLWVLAWVPVALGVPVLAQTVLAGTRRSYAPQVPNPAGPQEAARDLIAQQPRRNGKSTR